MLLVVGCVCVVVPGGVDGVWWFPGGVVGVGASVAEVVLVIVGVELEVVVASRRRFSLRRISLACRAMCSRLIVCRRVLFVLLLLLLLLLL